MSTPYVPTDPWLTVADAALVAQVCEKTIRTAIKRGHLRAVRLAAGRAYRVRASWVDAWLETFAAVVSVVPTREPQA
jgi:excisionase family DNA binding protein